MTTKRLWKIGVLSDIHGTLPDYSQWPDMDLLLMPGDLEPNQFDDDRDIELQLCWAKYQFRPWSDHVPASQIVITGGNHSIALQRRFERMLEHMGAWSPGTLNHELDNRFNNPVVLHDEPYDYLGRIKIFGNPCSYYPQKAVNYTWTFPYTEATENDTFSHILDKTQILLTHTPPFGILDNGIRDRKTGKSVHMGSKVLRQKTTQMNDLRLHCFGHEHFNGGGVYREDDAFSNMHVSVNAAGQFVYLEIEI